MDRKLFNIFRKASQSIYEGYPVYDVKVKFTLDDALSFMLGFDNMEFVFQQNGAGQSKPRKLW